MPLSSFHSCSGLSAWPIYGDQQRLFHQCLHPMARHPGHAPASCALLPGLCVKLWPITLTSFMHSTSLKHFCKHISVLGNQYPHWMTTHHSLTKPTWTILADDRFITSAFIHRLEILECPPSVKCDFSLRQRWKNGLICKQAKPIHSYHFVNLATNDKCAAGDWTFTWMQTLNGTTALTPYLTLQWNNQLEECNVKYEVQGATRHYMILLKHVTLSRQPSEISSGSVTLPCPSQKCFPICSQPIYPRILASQGRTRKTTVPTPGQ